MEITYKYVTEELRNQMISLRREFHQFPEQGFCEYRTSARIAGILESLGYEVKIGKEVCRTESRMGVPNDNTLECEERRALSEGADAKYIEKMRGGFTGVVGILKNDPLSEEHQKIKVLRFDIDALPVKEETGLEFISRHSGTMHACGHDGHTAVGLTVAKILAEQKNALAGEVRLIFQPAEEGVRGAKAIAENGWLDHADMFLSGHIGLGCSKVGRIQACTEGFMATTKLNLTFIGKAAHAAKNPQDGRNALLAAALFAVRSSEIPEKAPGKGLVNVGKFMSGSARNIIPDYAYLEMETRGENSRVNAFMEKQVRLEADAAARKYDVALQETLAGSSITTASSPELVKKLKKCADEMKTEDEYLSEGVMPASEDAAVMMDQVQQQGGLAAYYLFGSVLKGDHHQSTFDFDEETLSVMAEFLSRAVLEKT